MANHPTQDVDRGKGATTQDTLVGNPNRVRL
jgi:hypothetical protein